MLLNSFEFPLVSVWRGLPMKYFNFYRLMNKSTYGSVSIKNRFLAIKENPSLSRSISFLNCRNPILKSSPIPTFHSLNSPTRILLQNNSLNRSTSRLHSTHTDQDKAALEKLLEDYNKKEHKEARLFCAYSCKICSTRNHGLVSKVAFNGGTVIMRCKQCNNLHLMVDHLNWFGEGARSMQQILQAKGIQITTKDNLIEWIDGGRMD